MVGSFRAELRKLRKRPAVWVVGALVIALLVAFQYLLPYVVYATVPRGMPRGVLNALKQSLLLGYFPGSATSFLAGLGGALALILGVLSVGSEYGWGTVKTILTQRPGRISVFSGKALAVVLTLIVLVVLSFAAALLSSIVLTRVLGESVQMPEGGLLFRGLGASLLIVLAWTSLGGFLAVLFRNTALAVGIGLVYALVVEGIVGVFASLVDWVRNIHDFMLARNASALASVLPQPRTSSAPELSAAHSILVLSGWLVITFAIAVVVFRQRDVT